MRRKICWAVTLLAFAALQGCISSKPAQVTVPAWVAGSTLQLEQIWGVYSELAGTSWSAPNAYNLHFRWLKPGQVLVEDYLHPTTGQVVGSNTLIPGSRPGQLELISALGGMRWKGAVDEQGAVLLVSEGLLAMAPLRLRRGPDGKLLQERVRIKNGEVDSVDSTTRYAESVAPLESPATPEPTALAAASDQQPEPAQQQRGAESMEAAWRLERATVDTVESVYVDSGKDARRQAEQDAQVAEAMAQVQQLVQEHGIENEVAARVAEIQAHVASQSAGSASPAQAVQAPDPVQMPPARAKKGGDRIVVHDNEYPVSAQLPASVIGLYEYEGDGEPVIRIGQEHSAFQPHGVAEIDINVWIVVDESGRPAVECGPGGHRYMLVIQYGANGDGNYPPGSYSLFDVTFSAADNIAIMLGERFRPFTYQRDPGCG